MSDYISREAFPSPRGDKLHQRLGGTMKIGLGFRPLAGISCIVLPLRRKNGFGGFRPLAGISCIFDEYFSSKHGSVSVPSRG